MPFLLYKTLDKCNLGFPKILLYLLLLLSSNFYSQGVMAKVSGHHIAALDFLNTYTNTKNRISNPNPTTCGLTNTADNWYKENNISVKGLLSGAILVTDWWLLFNEPTENYNFQWKSSGKYQIEYFNKDGKQVFTTISKEMLSKYPDLLKRFNALKPLDVKFQINWRIGGHTDDDKDKFKKSYKIMGDIGSAMPHVKSDFTTKINNGLLFEASGVEPLSVPGIRQGKGKDFFGLSANYNDQKFKEILAYWNISKGHVINNFAVTQMRWPVAEMKSIAEKFEAYEKGTELSPKDQIKKADSIPITNKTKGDDAFWGDAFYEDLPLDVEIYRDGKTIGLKNAKKILTTFDSDKFDILKTKNSKLFILLNTCNLYFTHYIDDKETRLHLGCLIDSKGNKISFNSQNEYYISSKSGYLKDTETILIFTKNSESEVIRELYYVHSFYSNFPSSLKSSYGDVVNKINSYNNSASGVNSKLKYYFQIMECELIYLDIYSMKNIKTEKIFRPFYKKYTDYNGNLVESNCY